MLSTLIIEYIKENLWISSWLFLNFSYQEHFYVVLLSEVSWPLIYDDIDEN